MCFPPEISEAALPAFARVRDWRVEERGSKAWRPSYVLQEEVQKWSAADGAAQGASCDRAASRDHVEAAGLCAAGIKVPLQSPLVRYENGKAFDPEHSSTPARDRVVEGRGSLPLGSGGDVYERLEVTSPIAVEDLEKLEPELLRGGQGLICTRQPPGASDAPELGSIGSFSAWFDCMTKNDAEIEATSLIKERSTTTANFEVDTKPVKKAPKLTKREKKQKAAAAVHSHEGSEADVCTDDETEPVLMDEKRKRRMLSNRASAQRSRQRRQDRLDQLEVLTAQLRVENASLLRKSNLALQLARKFEGENKKLMEKAQNLTSELLEARKMAPARLHEECHSSPNTCPDFSEIVGEADFSPVVKLNPANAQDDDRKPLQLAASKSYVTLDDQIEMGYTIEDTDMTADCNKKRAESCKKVQVSEGGSPIREVKMANIRLPVSCKTGCESTKVFQLPSSIWQESLLTPMQDVPVMIPMTYSQDPFEEMCDLFESDTADHPYINNDIPDAMDQTWLNSFAECLNA